ncbi:MAG: hypothetical protein WC730_01470 [Patescibacteria group bacterium]|jgi:hypothetical protein
MIRQILIGLVISALGIMMVWKTGWALSMIGRVEWAERTFGAGGSRTFFKLMGVGLILIGFIVMTDLFDIFFGDFILGLFGY